MRGVFSDAFAILSPIFFIKAYVVGTHLNCSNEYQLYEEVDKIP